jgi:hypothetical protein
MGRRRGVLGEFREFFERGTSIPVKGRSILMPAIFRGRLGGGSVCRPGTGGEYHLRYPARRTDMVEA